MDYEQKYREALKKAEAFYYSATTEPISEREVLANIFPEIKESEDEMIRKELITHCRNTRCVTEEGAERIAKWISWLEKQGQVKESVISQHENKMCKENDDSLTSEDERIREALIDFFNGADGEQLFSMLKEAGYEWDAEKKELKKIEKKPTEDVDLPEFESYLCLMFQKFRTKGICTNGEIIDYVKEHSQKLKDILVNPTWSEEDKRMYQYIFNDLMFVKELVNDPNYAVSVDMVEKEIDWMESLKERYTWKPSDEQMQVLWKYAEQNNKDGSILTSLYQELKKLREEWL